MRRSRLANAILLMTLCGLLKTSSANAQNFERYRPQPLPPQAPVMPDIGTPPPEVTGSDRVLLEALEALIVVDRDDKIDKENANSDAVGLQLNYDNPHSIVFTPQFNSIVSSHLGQPVSLRSLNQLSRDIIDLYRQCKQPVVDVLIPEQKISGGTVQIVIIESRIGQVQVEEGDYFSADETARWIESTHSGSAIYEPWLEDDLFWLNQNPFRKVGIDLQPGAMPGTTDVLFTTEDVMPIRGYLGYDDTGVRALGMERLFAGVSYANLFGGGETLSYQYTTDSDFRRLHAHALTYNAPLSRRYNFFALGSWAGVDPDIGGGVTQNGESWQTGFGLIRTLNKNRYMDENIRIGFDFKSTNNSLEFGGFNITNSFADLVQLNLGYELFERDDCDQYSRFNADVWIGPGAGFTKYSDAAHFSTIRPDTSPDYFYARLRYEEAVNIFDEWQITLRGVGQLASERLLYSEMLGFGGYDSIRGYDQRTANGDNGWIASAELGPRPYQLCIANRPARLRMYGFFDAGQAIYIDPLPGENGDQMLMSTGVGMRLAVSQDLSFRCDYGHAFKGTPGDDRGDRIHLGLIWQFGPLASEPTCCQ